MNISDDCYFAYIVGHEAWYYDEARDRNGHQSGTGRYLDVQAAAEDGGCKWEFMIREYDLNGKTIRIEMFSDAFSALTEVPEFFDELQDDMSLNDVVEILDQLGAKDITKRESPYRPDPRRVALVEALKAAQGELDKFDNNFRQQMSGH